MAGRTPATAGHVFLVCVDEEARVDAAKKYLNYSLAKDIFVIYASVNVQRSFYDSKLYRKIPNCDKSIASGRLLVFELGTFFESAAVGDMEPYEDLKVLLEEIVNERKVAGHKNEIMIFGDCADFLSRCEMFEQCAALEEWWNKTCDEWRKRGVKITVICPHSMSTFAGHKGMDFREEISNLHTITLHARRSAEPSH